MNESDKDIYEDRVNRELLKELLEHINELPDEELKKLNDILQLKADR